LDIIILLRCIRVKRWTIFIKRTGNGSIYL
jgi:hypothetical protein